MKYGCFETGSLMTFTTKFERRRKNSFVPYHSSRMAYKMNLVIWKLYSVSRWERLASKMKIKCWISDWYRYAEIWTRLYLWFQISQRNNEFFSNANILYWISNGRACCQPLIIFLYTYILLEFFWVLLLLLFHRLHNAIELLLKIQATHWLLTTYYCSNQY